MTDNRKPEADALRDAYHRRLAAEIVAMLPAEPEEARPVLDFVEGILNLRRRGNLEHGPMSESKRNVNPDALPDSGASVSIKWANEDTLVDMIAELRAEAVSLNSQADVLQAHLDGRHNPGRT